LRGTRIEPIIPPEECQDFKRRVILLRNFCRRKTTVFK